MTDTRLNWLERWQRAIREQHRLMFDYNKHTLKDEYTQFTSCPVCGNERQGAIIMFEKDMFKYYRCKRCSLVYMNPRLNNIATAAFYNSNVNEIYNEMKFDVVSESTRMDNRINSENIKIIKAAQKSGKNGNLLEIGCAKGYFLKQAKEAGYRVWGLELNKKNCAYAADILGNTITNKELFDAKFNSEMFDVVYMRDVIEHIPNPGAVMGEINRILKPGGIVFIDTHNIDSLINLVVREKHVVIFGFEHPVHWSPKSIVKLFDISGFKLNKIYFQSLDFTFHCILGYFIEPAFTAIFPKSTSKASKLVFRLFRKFFTFSPFNKLDRKLMPRLSSILRRGSTMKVIAYKAKNII